MKNKFIIDNVYAKENKIYYEYRVEGEEKFKKLFWLGEFFSVEFNENIEGVPEGIMVIPLICNILPIIWVNNATIYTNELDKTFYKAIKDIKKGYKEMLPKIKFLGKVKASRKTNNNYKVDDKNITFFSGGIDSYSTLVRHFEERPDLVTIWGADIDFENENGWKVVKKYIEEIGQKYNLKNVLIKASVRRFIDNSELQRQYQEVLNDDWWHAMQHGIGLIGNIAPYAYKYKLNTIYFPSTYTKREKNIVCASRPEIDNSLRFGSTKVLHEGYDFNRQQKVDGISKYIEQNKDYIKLRVCYRSKNGGNCCECEKCYRSIMAFISKKIDPNLIGFKVDKSKISEIKVQIGEIIKQNEVVKPLWKDIQDGFKEQEEYWKKQEDISWVFDLKTD